MRGVAPVGRAPSPSPSLAGRGYMAATAAKREPRRRRCRQHSRRPEPTLGAVRGLRTPSMTRRSPVSVCVCVCVRGAPAGRLGRAQRRARRRRSRFAPLCVTLRRLPLNKGAFVPSPARPLHACGPARSGLAGASPRWPPGGGPGSPRGAVRAAGAPLPPGTPLAGFSAGPRPPTPGTPRLGCGPAARSGLSRFEARPAGEGGGGPRSVRWRGVSPSWHAAFRNAPASPPPSHSGDSASADSGRAKSPVDSANCVARTTYPARLRALKSSAQVLSLAINEV